MRHCKITLFLATLAATLTLSAAARADTVTYDYTGQAFTPYASGAYTTTDFISGTFTLSAPLAANLTGLTIVTPVSFSFTDDVNTISSSSANLITGQFEFETDGTGAITAYSIILQTACSGCYTPGDSYPYHVTRSPIDQISVLSVPQVPGSSVYVAAGNAYNDISFYSNGSYSYEYDEGSASNETAGSLTEPAIASTPEPSAFILAGTGLLGIAFLTRRRRLFKPSVFALAAAILPLSARADTVTYTYKGPAFTSVDAPYTTQDSITGSFTVGSPLDDDMALTEISPVSFSFTDGVTTVDTADFTHGYIEVATNQYGQIDEWDIELDTPCIGCATTGYNEIDSYYFGGAYGTDSSIYDDNGSTSQASASANGLGQWSATPEPPSLMLLATGLAGSAAVLRRRCRAIN